jgi:hypothetical protein
VLAVQHLQRGDVQQQPAARLQHARHFLDRRLFDRVGQNLEDVERRRQVDGAARERDVADARLDDAMPVRAGELGADARHIEAGRAAVGPQHLEIRSGAAAAIENPRRRPPFSGAHERGLDVLTEAAKPEVRLFGAVSQLE